MPQLDRFVWILEVSCLFIEFFLFFYVVSFCYVMGFIRLFKLRLKIYQIRLLLLHIYFYQFKNISTIVQVVNNTILYSSFVVIGCLTNYVYFKEINEWFVHNTLIYSCLIFLVTPIDGLSLISF